MKINSVYCNSANDLIAMQQALNSVIKGFNNYTYQLFNGINLEVNNN